MRSFSCRDAAKAFGDLLDAADREPVMVHRYGRPRVAVIGYDLFREYKKAYDKASDERLIALVEKSCDLLVEGKLGQSGKALALAKRLGLGETKGAGA